MWKISSAGQVLAIALKFKLTWKLLHSLVLCMWSKTQWLGTNRASLWNGPTAKTKSKSYKLWKLFIALSSTKILQQQEGQLSNDCNELCLDNRKKWFAKKAVFRGFTALSFIFITTRTRSLRGGTILSCVCPSNLGGGGYHGTYSNLRTPTNPSDLFKLVDTSSPPPPPFQSRCVIYWQACGPNTQSNTNPIEIK